MHKAVFLGILLVVTCSNDKVNHTTDDFLPGKQLAKLNDDRLKELSGLAASINNNGLLWTHNDSGNDSEVFLIDEKLNVKLTCILKGIENRDWEDITVGPGPEAGKNYIYIGEIGDNEARYALKHIYRFEEPKLKAGTDKVEITRFDRITFKLADKRKDTESLLIDPKTKNLYIVSKREKPVHVYELKYPQSTTDTLVANSIATIPFTQIVAGDFSADGKKILMKNYEHVYYWNNTEGKPLAELLKETPLTVPYEVEPQGEAVTWARNGSGFYTISEKNIGKDSYLYFYKKK